MVEFGRVSGRVKKERETQGQHSIGTMEPEKSIHACDHEIDRCNSPHTCAREDHVVPWFQRLDKHSNSLKKSLEPRLEPNGTIGSNNSCDDLNQSYLMEKTVIDTIKKIMSTNKNSKIGTAEILNGWINGVDKPSFKELDEKIIPTMAASGLLALHNGTVERTSKQMPDPSQSSQPSDSSALTHLLITQDIPEFSWTDGDWKLRKNDDAYVPLELAKTLISRGWAREIQKTSGHDSTTDSTVSNSSEDNKQEEPKNPNPTTTEPITKEQGDQAVQVLHERGIHLNGADTGVSVYGDKYNIAVPVNFYRQNAERVDQVMSELGFSKGNTGQLHNVFFDKPMKGGETQ